MDVCVMSEVVAEPQGVEEALIERFRSGDSEALSLLFEQYSGRLFWVAYQMLRNHEDALDAVQDTFIKVINAIERFDTSRKFYTWVCQILINHCVDRMRTMQSRSSVSFEDVGTPPAQQETPEHLIARDETKRQVFSVMGRMPETYRTVLILREIEGLSCKEIGEMLGVTHATIRWRLHRARRMFRRVWEKEFEKKK